MPGADDGIIEVGRQDEERTVVSPVFVAIQPVSPLAINRVQALTLSFPGSDTPVHPSNRNACQPM